MTHDPHTTTHDPNEETTLGVSSSFLSNLEPTKSDFSARARTVNLFLSGKGGCGKSLSASLLAQYLLDIDRPVVILDGDPVQSSLKNTEGLGAEVFDLLDGERVNVNAMDALLTRILDDDEDFIVDVGAAGFVPFSSFMMRDSLFDVIAGEGKRVVVHAIIAGGGALYDTVLGLNDMLRQFPRCAEFVVWQNPYFGPLSTDEGKPLEGGPFWKENAGRFSGVVRLPLLDPHYAGAIFREMLAARLTIKEALAADRFNRIAKLRLSKAWDEIKSHIWAAV